MDKLKELVTTDPSDVIHEATGIPPRVEHCLKLENLLQVSSECLQLLKNQVVDVKQVSHYYSMSQIEILPI